MFRFNNHCNHNDQHQSNGQNKCNARTWSDSLQQNEEFQQSQKRRRALSRENVLPTSAATSTALPEDPKNFNSFGQHSDRKTRSWFEMDSEPPWNVADNIKNTWNSPHPRTKDGSSINAPHVVPLAKKRRKEYVAPIPPKTQADSLDTLSPTDQKIINDTPYSLSHRPCKRGRPSTGVEAHPELQPIHYMQGHYNPHFLLEYNTKEKEVECGDTATPNSTHTLTGLDKELLELAVIQTSGRLSAEVISKQELNLHINTALINLFQSGSPLSPTCPLAFPLISEFINKLSLKWGRSSNGNYTSSVSLTVGSAWLRQWKQNVDPDGVFRVFFTATDNGHEEILLETTVLLPSPYNIANAHLGMNETELNITLEFSLSRAQRSAHRLIMNNAANNMSDIAFPKYKPQSQSDSNTFHHRPYKVATIDELEDDDNHGEYKGANRCVDDDDMMDMSCN